ncbi:MAG: hypothetical protein Q7R33_09585 [Nitrosarchaeum sp.]|nr:hypothetical protein [Nitrosarchaeum sp.]
MKYFKIKKCFQGGESIFFAKMSSLKFMPKDNWQDQLESWGEATHGGHNYGYRIYCKRIKNLPKGKKIFLSFNQFLLNNMKRRKNAKT